MAVPRAGRFWRRAFIVLLIAVVAVYAFYARDESPHGGSPVGLAYGIAGLALILLLAFFGIRKRWYRSRFGTLEQWLQSHIYLGILVVVVLLLHSGGRFEDSVAVATLALVLIVAGSGVVGAVFYATVPRLLTEVESDLSAADISEQLNQLARSMARISSDKSAAFQKVFHELIRESAPRGLAGWRLLVSRLRRKQRTSGQDWSALVAFVPRDEQDDLREMLVIARQRRELLLRLMMQQRYKNILEAWLYVHVPFTFALLIFSVVHVVGVLYYGALR